MHDNIRKTGFFRKYLLIIIATVLIIAVLLPFGIFMINKKTGFEAKQSSYKLTSFDYVITSPTKEQVDNFAANSAVNQIFPCYNFEITANGGYRFPLLMCDSLNGYDVSLFNTDTCISGGADASGIMLDETAAKHLNVKVGDTVSFVMGGKNVSLRVSGIYMASTYRNLEKGLGLAVFTNEMKSYFADEIGYKLAFIDAEDVAQCERMLDGYIPYGECLSETAYLANRKKNESRPADMSDTEWENGMKDDYLIYKERFENTKYPYAVQVKSLFMKDAEDQFETREEDISQTSLILAIAAFAVYMLFGIVNILINQRNDDILFSYGASKSGIVSGYACAIIVFAILAAITVGATLYAVASAGNHLAVCIPLIILLAVPVLPAALITVIFATLYFNGKYHHN